MKDLIMEIDGKDNKEEIIKQRDNIFNEIKKSDKYAIIGVILKDDGAAQSFAVVNAYHIESMFLMTNLKKVEEQINDKIFKSFIGQAQKENDE